MKKALALTLVAVLALGGVALAANLPFGAGRWEAERFVHQLCASQHGCERTKIIRCRRESRSRVDCGVATYYSDGTICTFVVVTKLDGQTVKQRTRQVRC
jgi:hypothetical protein